MAERRMFAKTIIGSGRFLQMPATSRLLYYDLGMEADDDGIVEAIRVMRATGATEDDLKILCAKGFVRVLNKELVSLICDWKTNNYIQKDRYHKSVYAQLIADKPPESAVPTTALDPPGTDTECIHDGSDLDTECIQPVSNPYPEVRLGKDSIRENTEIANAISESKPQAVSNKPDAVSKVPYEQIVSLYHRLCPSFGRLRMVEGKRKQAIAARWRVTPDLSVFEELFRIAESSDFLKGRNPRNWRANFDWLMGASNFQKVLEHRYDNQQGSTGQSDRDPFIAFMDAAARGEEWTQS